MLGLKDDFPFFIVINIFFLCRLTQALLPTWTGPRMVKDFKALLQITSCYFVREIKLISLSNKYLQILTYGPISLLLQSNEVVAKGNTCCPLMCFISLGDAVLGEQLTESASLRNTEWDTHNCVLGYPVIGKLRCQLRGAKNRDVESWLQDIPAAVLRALQRMVLHAGDNFL